MHLEGACQRTGFPAGADEDVMSVLAHLERNVRPMPDTRCPMPDTPIPRYPDTPIPGHLVSGIWYRASGVWYLVFSLSPEANQVDSRRRYRSGHRGKGLRQA